MNINDIKARLNNARNGDMSDIAELLSLLLEDGRGMTSRSVVYVSGQDSNGVPGRMSIRALSDPGRSSVF